MKAVFLAIKRIEFRLILGIFKLIIFQKNKRFIKAMYINNKK